MNIQKLGVCETAADFVNNHLEFPKRSAKNRQRGKIDKDKEEFSFGKFNSDKTTYVYTLFYF